MIAVPLAAVVTTGQAAAAPPVAAFVPCPPGVTATCGTVDVPLDRAEPGAGTIRLFFEWFRHTNTSWPSLGAIVPSAGGPGLANSTLTSLGLWPSIFRPLLDRRDLLVIDDRGTGQSAAIDCPALQHFTGDVVSAVRACGAQLGAAASRYGSGDVAEDVEAVRAALGIDQIVYYGGSFGAHNLRAYAYRYPERLQAAVFDSPWLSPDYTFQASNARFFARVQATVCRRSPACVDANPFPEADLAWLAWQLRAHPFDGTGFDATGVPHAGHVDESTIIDVLSAKYNSTPLFLNQGELTAAAHALRHGDRTPLLRLVAESSQNPEVGRRVRSCPTGPRSPTSAATRGWSTTSTPPRRPAARNSRRRPLAYPGLRSLRSPPPPGGPRRSGCPRACPVASRTTGAFRGRRPCIPTRRPRRTRSSRRTRRC